MKRKPIRKFDAAADEIMKSSKERKPPLPKNRTILSGKDKYLKNDKKKGRKNWTDYK